MARKSCVTRRTMSASSNCVTSIAKMPAKRTPSVVSPKTAVPKRMNQAIMGGWSRKDSALSVDQVQNRPRPCADRARRRRRGASPSWPQSARRRRATAARPGSSRWRQIDRAGSSSRRFLLDSPGGVKAPRDAGELNQGFNCSGIVPRIRNMDGMTPPSSEQIRTLARGIGLRQVRLVSGMILFAYVLSHFLNHALGNISLEAMADGVQVHTAFWQFLPVAVVFYTACLVNAELG